MNYGKAILSGLLGALLACVLWIVVKAVLPIAFEMVRVRISGEGAGGASASIDSNEVLVAAIIGFAGGWYWRARGKPR